MTLVDGISFGEMNKILPKINLHARYLITYNFIQELQNFINLALWQKDNNWGNFMITSGLDVKIIDFGGVSKDSWNSQLTGIPVLWFDLLFSNGDQFKFSPKPNLKNYLGGTFGNLMQQIDKNRDSYMIIAYTLCKECPKFS